ncbi:MAG: TatD DNase family protein [Actinomycetota bacterium]|nr:TatD DNase family protein [Actinomycetota bacterium]
MWFDTHCHLYDLDDPESAVERAREAGVFDMVVLGVDAEQSKKAVDLTRLEGVWAGAAVHPTSAKGWEDSWADDIDALLGNERVVAVGETGIDLHWDTSYLEDQTRAFEKHIELAKKHGKALVIHTRKSFAEAASILEGVGPPPKLVFHCWSGSEDEAKRALELGSMISFAGNVSFKNAEDLREVARTVPAVHLLVETDAPYLAPVPHRGKTNEPAFVVNVGVAVAEARGETLEAIAEVTTANAQRLFGLD